MELKYIEFIKKDVVERFLRYIKINTKSDEHSGTHPSSEGQWDLANLLKNELEDLGLENIELDQNCYLYAKLSKNNKIDSEPITFCAHMDTAPAEEGKNVKPIIHENYDGNEISFPDNKSLFLSPKDSPVLLDYLGKEIITASGKTLLGADDKAGISEIMTTLALLKKYPEIEHPELRIVFTPDEEIGQGADLIDLSKCGTYGYTVDGGEMGELEDECFDAYGMKIEFLGHVVHPGEAKNKMINACSIATRFNAELPENETPENTEGCEGFYHLCNISGDESKAFLEYILRDFDKQNNIRRIQAIKNLARYYETIYPGLRINLYIQDQYSNMKEILKNYPEVTLKARKAIQMSGIEVIQKGIRGGTDGARLSFMGMPTPNIFTGGVLFHSNKEWIAPYAMQKACETLINLCILYSMDDKDIIPDEN